MKLRPIFLVLLAFLALPDFDAEAEAFHAPGTWSISPRQLRPGQLATIRYEPARPVIGKVYLHLGYNGWNLPLSGEGVGRESVRGNQNEYQRLAMRLEAGGIWAVDFRVPDAARAIHFVFCWAQCGNGQWDNNQGKDYAWPIVFPYIGPLIGLAPGMDGSTSLTIAFEHPETATAWLRYAEKGGAWRRLESMGGRMHRFHLQPLRPATTYQYQVGVGSEFSSEIHEFSTLPVNGPLRFAVIGDAQDNGENGQFARLAAAMADSEPDLQLVISTGDLPWNDHPGDWWSFFDKGRPIFNRWLFLPAVGNHDTPGVGSSRDHQSFLHYFAVPTDSPEVAHYQFQASNVRFYAMNSERPDEFQPKGAQYQWLEQRLTDRSSRRQGSPCAWRMAYWHIPPFNAGRRHYRSQFQFRPLLQLFAERIDWQFSGHEHMYQRFEPIRPVGFRHQLNDQYGRRRDGGVGYAIIPSGGVYPEGRFIDYSVNPALRAALAFPRLAASENFYQSAIGFLRVEVDGARFRLNSLQVDASGQVGLIDAVDYRRSDCEVDWLWGWP